MVTVIADTPRGSVETPFDRLSVQTVRGMARDGHREAIRELARRLVRPGWAVRVSDGRRSRPGGGG
jgi:hypothetical protein